MNNKLTKNKAKEDKPNANNFPSHNKTPHTTIIRKTKKPFWKNENGKSGREEGKTKTESSPTRTQKKDSV